jgi:FAD-linked oxidoreductase
MSKDRVSNMGWSNWSGSVTAAAEVLRPKSVHELAAAVRDATSVRAVGAGHSFMPLVASDTLIVCIEDLPGEIVLSADRRTARVPAGRSIRQLTAELFALGYALANQGDVNPQSIAGSMATGTHGTGRDIGSLSTMARGFRLMGPDGKARWCDAATEPELFQAQRVSLGLFGIATEVEIEIVPAFYLEERLTRMSFDEARERFAEFEDAHRHVEFFVFPYSNDVIFKTLSLTEPCEAPASTTDMEEASFKRVLDAGRLAPFAIGTLQKQIMRGNFDSQRQGPAYTIYPSDRSIRFEEMEYEMPREAGFDALAQAIAWVRKKRLPLSFPLEYRVVAGDDIWMSPMNAGPAASISVHQYGAMDWRKPFAEIEPIFRKHGGRPHWAKRHSLTRADVDALYPMAERFREVRRKADPMGKFLNPHVTELFS